MTTRSIRSRLHYSGKNRPYDEILYWGIKWEGLRAAYFAQNRQWEQSEDCLARQQFFERELNDLAKGVQS